MGAAFNQETIRKRDTTNYHGYAGAQQIHPEISDECRPKAGQLLLTE
jgi:hypothetical protein